MEMRTRLTNDYKASHEHKIKAFGEVHANE
jgi:hypothetical protein